MEQHPSPLTPQASAFFALSRELFGLESVDKIAQELCDRLVKDLGWKSAAVVSLLDGPPALQAGSHLADAAATELVAAFGPDGDLAKASADQKEVVEDDRVAAPIVSGGQLGAYLVALAEPGSMTKDDAAIVSQAAWIAGYAFQASRLQSLADVKNTFVNATSHQLRTPLASIKWIFSVLKTDAQLTKMPEQLGMINQAYESVERIIDVVNDLLNVARIQDGRLPYSPGDGDPKEIIQDVVKNSAEVAASRNLTFKVDVDSHIPSFKFDAILFREALQNLVNNAIDYSGEKGEIGVAAKKDGDSLVVTVTNSGPGIKGADKDNIFQPFYRSQATVGMNPNGSGLGLYLVRAIALEHGGSIRFESEPDKQTAFTLTIPIR